MKQYRKKYIDYYADEYKKMHGIDIRKNDFDVHHIDHDKNNNSMDNLVLLPRILHRRYHKIHSEMQRHEFAIPRKIVGKNVCNDTYMISLTKEYFKVLEECADWKHAKDMIDIKNCDGKWGIPAWLRSGM